jgi:hypothetical protein
MPSVDLVFMGLNMAARLENVAHAQQSSMGKWLTRVCAWLRKLMVTESIRSSLWANILIRDGNQRLDYTRSRRHLLKAALSNVGIVRLR